jgi:8-oxo-dGTP pyrophosphatase MutT (NUDIX family)
VKDRIARRLEGSAPTADPAAEALGRLSPGLARVLFPEPLVNAAVLVPIILHPGGMTLLLTRRTDHLKDHPGQIGFPGGRMEPGDEGPVQTALREVREEIGLAPGAVEIVGHLEPLAVVTGFAVSPVVGFVAPGIDLELDGFEVAEAFEVPLGFFLDEASLRRSLRQVRGVEVPLFEYRYEERRIWGATAQMIHCLCNKIR